MSIRLSKPLKRIAKEAKIVDTVVTSVQSSFHEDALIKVKCKPELILRMLTLIAELSRTLIVTDTKQEELFFLAYRRIFGMISEGEISLILEIVHFFIETKAIIPRGLFRRTFDYMKSIFRSKQK